MKQMSDMEKKIRYALAGFVLFIFGYMIITMYVGKIAGLIFFTVVICIMGYIGYLYLRPMLNKLKNPDLKKDKDKVNLEVYR